MSTMFEETFIAHALRDYLRPIAGESEVKWMDMSIGAGEPVSAILMGLGIAEHFSVSLPPLFVEKIEGIKDLRDFESQFIEEKLANLPTWWELAS